MRKKPGGGMGEASWEEERKVPRRGAVIAAVTAEV